MRETGTEPRERAYAAGPVGAMISCGPPRAALGELLGRAGFEGLERDVASAGSPAASPSAAGPGASAADMHLRRCARALLERGVPPDRPVCAFVVPGRIEVLGKHTDYAGGRSLVVAVDRGFHLVAAPREDDRLVMHDVANGDTAEARLTPPAGPEPTAVRPPWSLYPATVAARVGRNFAGARTGADVAFFSDLPQAAGLSSSSAFVVATFLALAAVNDLERSEPYRTHLRTAEALAEYLSAVENGADYGALGGWRGVGTRGGSQDHVAILCARPGRLVRYAFRPVRFEGETKIPGGYVFVVASSGVRAEKAGSALESYNRASDEAAAIAELWRAATGGSEPHLGAVLACGPDAAARVREVLRASPHPMATPDTLISRLEQFHAECLEIIPAACAALDAGDVAGFGALVDRSQALAERALRNQIPETVHLARSARALGAAAASAFGAGFGGSVWALIEASRAASFLDAWRREYRAAFPARAPRAEFFVAAAGPGARRVV